MFTVKKKLPDLSIESDYSKSVSLKHRKKFAQFFTPFPISDLMAKWILGNEHLKTVLEPAFGLGLFSRALLSRKKEVSITGFEIDPTIFENSRPYFSGLENVTVHLQDYMDSDWGNHYDGILCNPPYFKFHDYDNKNLVKEIESHLKCKLNAYANLYTLFLLKSIHQLSWKGRCAYIVPSEFLNSDYGKRVKACLLKSRTLRYIFVVNSGENIFEDALTTASIILCARDNSADKVHFGNIQSLQDLKKIEKLMAAYPQFPDLKLTRPLSELDPEIKWKAYYQKQYGIRFKNLVPFSTYAKVVRGIATGSNPFFTFTKSKAKKFSIGSKFLLPCICKARDAKGPFFTLSDFEKLKSDDKSVFLLKALNSTDEKVKAYLAKGEADGIDKKFLTASRVPWYSLEKRPPAPIWVSVFNRTGLRFIRNEAGISNLTSFHCIYPKPTDLFCTMEIDLLFAYLLTDTARLIFEDNCREYGNGLQKFEPNDIHKGQMLDLSLLSRKAGEQILNLYRHYRLEILKNKNGENLLEDINNILIEQYT